MRLKTGQNILKSSLTQWQPMRQFGRRRLYENDEAQPTGYQSKMIKRASRWLAGLILLISAAILINFSGVMFASMNYWFPRMAAGRMTFLQVLYAEWVGYCTSHRCSWVVGDDLPGLAIVALIVLPVGYFKRRQHHWRAANVATAKPDFLDGNTGVWPPAPKI